jgi:hypothetical protein
MFFVWPAGPFLKYSENLATVDQHWNEHSHVSDGFPSTEHAEPGHARHAGKVKRY